MIMPVGTQRAIIRAIIELQRQKNEPITIRDIATHTGYGYQTVWRNLSQLVSNGALERQPAGFTGGKRGWSYRYQVICNV